MATLEVYDRFDQRGMPVTLTGDEFSIGRDDGNDLVLKDKAVSSDHAVLRRYRHRWSVRDVGSTNGTYLNGDRIVYEMLLRDRYEITVGHTRLVYLNASENAGTVTETDVIAPPPPLTPGEHEVLVELCRPILTGTIFVPPATVTVIADRRCTGEGAVRAHLAAMVSKFGVEGGAGSRVRLAQAAINRGAVTMQDLLDDPGGDSDGA